MASFYSCLLHVPCEGDFLFYQIVRLGHELWRSLAVILAFVDKYR